MNGGPCMTRGTLTDHFWSRVDRTGDCWLWTGALTGKVHTSGGYGTVVIEGKTRLAHRVVYEALVGPIPTGLTLDHLCRVQACVNPAHLEPVTIGENVRRSAPATKTQCVNGHPYNEANTYRGADGRRHCRACARERMRLRRGENA